MIVITKQTKSDKLDLDAVRQNPEGAVSSLLRGWVNIRSTIPNQSMRGMYNSNTRGWQRGRNTFIVSCVIPDETAHAFRGVLVTRENGCFDEEDFGIFSIGENLPRGDYSGISIPDSLVSELTRHTAISGGVTEDIAPLQELHIGEAVRPKLDEAKMMREGRSMAFRR